MELYHFSEIPYIERLEPRTPAHHPGTPPYIWAIDAWHSPLYMFPTQCPRMGFWRLPTTTESDAARWLWDSNVKMILACQADWLARLRSTKLYRYTLPVEGFEDLHDHGAWRTGRSIEPTSCEPVGDLMDAITGAGAELRIVPSLIAPAQQLMDTTLHWSLVRFSNLPDWPLNRQ